jgi:hypothetical protein
MLRLMPGGCSDAGCSYQNSVWALSAPLVSMTLSRSHSRSLQPRRWSALLCSALLLCPLAVQPAMARGGGGGGFHGGGRAGGYHNDRAGDHPMYGGGARGSFDNNRGSFNNDRVPHCQQSCPLGLTRPPGGPTDDHATAL